MVWCTEKVLKEKERTANHATLTYKLIETIDEISIICEVDYLLELACTGRYIGEYSQHAVKIFSMPLDITVDVDDPDCGSRDIMVAAPFTYKEIMRIAMTVFNKL